MRNKRCGIDSPDTSARMSILNQGCNGQNGNPDDYNPRLNYIGKHHTPHAANRTVNKDNHGGNDNTCFKRNPKAGKDTAAGKKLGDKNSQKARYIADPCPEADAFAVPVSLCEEIKRHIAFLLAQLSRRQKPGQN